jgi:hypothetical protein
LRRTDEEDVDSFTINFEQPEKNPHGYFCIRAQKIDKGSEQLDALVIYKALYDPRDAKAGNFVMELLPDRTGVTVTEPTVAHAFVNDVLQIHKNEIKTGKFCKMTEQEHKMQSAILLQNPDRLQMVRTIKFPNGMTCSADVFSSKDSKNKQLVVEGFCRFLPTEMKMGESSNKAKFCIPYICWKLAIDNSYLPLDQSSGKSKDLIDDAFQSMSLNDQLN